jgi:prepilin peptidase CpaA
MQSLTLPLIAIMFGASAWAVSEDLTAHRIPNRLTGSLLVIGLILQFASGGWSALGQGALGTLIGLAVLLPLYLLRATGAGDVKFLAALGALLGPRGTLLAGVYTLLAGGLLALGYLGIGALRAAVNLGGAPLLMRIHTFYARARELRRAHFPYALAIAVGAIATIIQRGDLQAALAHVTGARS